MPMRKELYQDIDKYQETRRAQLARYRRRTGTGQYKKRAWTDEEDRQVLAHACPDRELSLRIHRSVLAISVRRAKLKQIERDDDDV